MCVYFLSVFRQFAWLPQRWRRTSPQTAKSSGHGCSGLLPKTISALICCQTASFTLNISSCSQFNTMPVFATSHRPKACTSGDLMSGTFCSCELSLPVITPDMCAQKFPLSLLQPVNDLKISLKLLRYATFMWGTNVYFPGGGRHGVHREDELHSQRPALRQHPGWWQSGVQDRWLRPGTAHRRQRIYSETR